MLRQKKTEIPQILKVEKKEKQYLINKSLNILFNSN